jgi:integrase
VRQHNVQCLISAALEHGYSVQTATHIRNAVHAVFEYARALYLHDGENPARRVELPAATRKETPSLTLAQTQQVLEAMRHPEKELTLFLIFTGMFVAEVSGLQWKRVNLTAEPYCLEGESIPPRTIAIRKQWSCGVFQHVAQKGRLRNIPIPEPLVPMLLALRQHETFAGPDDFVLSTRAGQPVNGSTIAARRLKDIAKLVQLPELSWHVFQRTHTTIVREFGTNFLRSYEAAQLIQAGLMP